MERKMDEILLDYSSKTIKDGDLYYIVEYLKEEDSYVVYKYDGKEDSVLKIKKEELPNEASVNTALRIKEGSYIIDETATIELKEKVTNMANELLEEQNKLLEGYRKEGHLYKVSENINGSVFIYDITDDPKIEIEEVDFPEELKEIAHEGTVFEYIDGKYRIKTTDK